MVHLESNYDEHINQLNTQFGVSCQLIEQVAQLRRFEGHSYSDFLSEVLKAGSYYPSNKYRAELAVSPSKADRPGKEVVDFIFHHWKNAKPSNIVLHDNYKQIVSSLEALAYGFKERDRDRAKEVVFEGWERLGPARISLQQLKVLVEESLRCSMIHADPDRLELAINLLHSLPNVKPQNDVQIASSVLDSMSRKSSTSKTEAKRDWAGHAILIAMNNGVKMSQSTLEKIIAGSRAKETSEAQLGLGF